MQLKIERLELGDLSNEVLASLEGLYRQSFHNSHMYEYLLRDIEEAPAIFQLFLVRLPEMEGEVVGARVIETKAHASVDYRGFLPVHGKRFSVLPSMRGQGVGRSLVAAGKSYCFDDLGLSVIFGESNEFGALAMHGREGALYHLDSIEGMSSRNSPGENLEFFGEMARNPKFRTYRIPVGGGIQFVYCRDEETTASFEGWAYAPLSALLTH